MSESENETRVRDLEFSLRLTRVEYVLERKELAEEFGVRLSDLDELWREHGLKSEKPEPKEGEEVWPEEVEGDELLTGILDQLKRFIVADESALIAVALWIIHAHAHDAFDISPILLATSPTKGCGKSTLLDLVETLVPRPLMSANSTPAALYRSTADRPTILVDEADLYFSDDPAVVAFFNAGHRRGTPFRRCVGDSHEVTAFESWTPKALAQIGMPRHPTIVDRSLVIPLRRKLKHERAEKFRKSNNYEDLINLKPKAARWVQDNLEALRESRPTLPSSLDNRAADNWECLFSIASVVGCGWDARLGQVVKDVHHEPEDEREQLLRDLLALIDKRGTSFITTKTIVDDLLMSDESPYLQINRGKQITPHWVVKQLKAFGLESTRERSEHGQQARGFHVAPIRDVCARYLTSESVTSVTSDTNGASVPDVTLVTLPEEGKGVCTPEHEAESEEEMVW